MSDMPTKRAVLGTFVKLLFHKRTERGMTLIAEKTRCVRAGELHELVTTDHKSLGPGARVDRTGFLGFAEITRAGVLEAGDRVVVGTTEIGRVVGFDACHFPNHYNVIIETDVLLTGDHPAVAVEASVRFEPAPGRPEEVAT